MEPEVDGKKGKDLEQSWPFNRIRVVDFTHILAGPACSYYLGLLGADVIKLEKAYRGDAIRHRGGTAKELAHNAMSTSYLTQAAGKRSISIDLDRKEGKEIVLRLIEISDVLVENHRPSTMRRLGMDYETLSKQFPQLIYCSVTGYGQTGPKSDFPAYDVNIQAASGLMSLTGTPESGPLRTGAPIMDYGSALAAAYAIAAALFDRQQTKKGSLVDLSMLEVGLNLMSSTITDYTATGNEPQPRGNAANSRSPVAGSFETKQGLISLGVNEEHQFAALCRAIQKPEWIEDERFCNRHHREINRQVLLSELKTLFADRPASEWESILGDAGVPVACVSSLPEALHSSQIQSRKALHPVEIDGFPEYNVNVPTLPFLYNGKRPEPTQSPPVRGQHSVKILKDIGIKDFEIEELISKKIIEQAL